MTLDEVAFQCIVTGIDEAIESEVGEKREYNATTQETLSAIQALLITILELPEDHRL